MKYLKIGGHQVELKIEDLDSRNLLGETDFNNPSIVIDKNTCQSFKESSLLHEVMHAQNTTLDSNEFGHSLLASLSEQMYQFLSDNGLLNKEAFLALFESSEVEK
jgi:hypothetical protein